jgi:hypothetical protein
MVAEFEIQRIAKLTPLGDVLASFDLSIRPVAAREEALAAALGLTLAADIVIPAGHPETAIALRDGYAVRAEATADASSYAPAPLSPAPQRIDAGEDMPATADAVAALDVIQAEGRPATPTSRARTMRLRPRSRRRADWGVAIEPVARLYWLGFLPLSPEEYDFLLVDSRRERPAVQAFIAALRDPRTRERIKALEMQPADD